MNVLPSNFADVVLIPADSIQICPPGEVYETRDGERVKVKFLSTWNNVDGRYDNELNMICNKRWGIDFAYLRSMWISRLSKVDDFWHLIKLEKI